MICYGGIPGCTRKRYTYNGPCRACAMRLKRRGTVDYATPEERSEVGRKAGLASVAALKERLGEEAALEYQRGVQRRNTHGGPTWEARLAMDQARQQEQEAKRRKRAPKEVA